MSTKRCSFVNPLRQPALLLCCKANRIKSAPVTSKLLRRFSSARLLKFLIPLLETSMRVSSAAAEIITNDTMSSSDRLATVLGFQVTRKVATENVGALPTNCCLDSPVTPDYVAFTRKEINSDKAFSAPTSAHHRTPYGISRNVTANGNHSCFCNMQLLLNEQLMRAITVTLVVSF